MAVTESPTEAEPVPLAPLVTEMNESFDTAVHVQPETVVTDTVSVPPVEANDDPAGEMLKVQPELCWTVKV